MSLVEQSQKDAQQFLTNTNEFGVSITLTAPDSTVLEVNGWHVKHHTGYDIESGVMVNSKMGSVAITELDLINAGYPYRNADGEVKLLDHTVVVADVTTTPKTFTVRENYPDETLGVIVLILGDRA